MSTPAAPPEPPPTPTAAPSGAPRRPMARGAAIASLAVMGSRLLGLVREQVFAYLFGASREYDAFLTAFRIPNLLRDLLAEGALSSAFVAVFVREMGAGGTQRAYALANSVANALAVALLGIVACGIIWAPGLVHAMAWGFDADKAALTVALCRLMFPFILFVALAAVCMGMLNAQERYALPQSASTFFNITSIVVGLSGAYALSPEYVAALWHHTEVPRSAAASAGALWGIPALASPAARAMAGMAMGTLCGGLVQWLVQVPLLLRLGWRYRPHIAVRDPALRQVLALMAPAVLGAAAVQLSVFINSNFASCLGERAISWLGYSFRLMQFPIGVFGVAVMTATLPALARHAAQRQHDAFGQALTEALELVLCLTVPAMVGLAVLGGPIVCLLFEHGRFGPADTAACAAALAAYALGLPGYSALKVVQPAFVALGDARTPMRVTLFGVAASAGLNALFVFGLRLGHVGLAMSTSLMATGSTCALLVLLERRQPLLGRRRLAGQAARILGAALLMGAALAAVRGALVHLPALRPGSMGRAASAAAQLALLMPVAATAYVLAARALGVTALQAAFAAARRRGARKGR